MSLAGFGGDSGFDAAESGGDSGFANTNNEKNFASKICRLIVLEDHDAVIKIVVKKRCMAMRHFWNTSCCP